MIILLLLQLPSWVFLTSQQYNLQLGYHKQQAQSVKEKVTYIIILLHCQLMD